MSDNVDFDALARKTAASDGTMGDLNNLWGAAFALSEWHFIARGELPNVRPYIASNAEYAEGKQMIRAFTDTARLQRFAVENNLTGADGSAQILSLPTAKLVEYLEQFIPYGVHGIWFNSDTQSDGFFLPLAQLRPVKEYLAKMNWQPPAAEEPAPASPDAASAASSWESSATTPETPSVEAEPPVETPAQKKSERVETLVVTVKDGLALPSGFISQASYACNFFCRVPESWIQGDTLKSDHLEKIYEQVYGQNWRMGNDDGSRYVVLDSSVKILAPDEVKTGKWSEIANTNENHFWFYIAGETGEIRNVKAEEFQAEVDAAPSIETETDAPAEASAAAPGAEFPNLHKGEVSFDASIEPFQEKLASLLENYHGAGEFTDIFSLPPSAMEGLLEKTLSNRHGAFLRARHFFYQPDSGTMVSVNTLDSIALRETENAPPLRVNVALLKYLINQTALLYFKFEGADADVQKLTEAFKPVLDASGFKEN